MKASEGLVLFSTNYTAKSVEGVIGSSSTLAGTIKLRLEVQHSKIFGRNDVVPQVSLTLDPSDDLARKFLTIDADFFDQPAAAKTLVGLMTTANRLTKDDGQVVTMDLGPKGF